MPPSDCDEPTLRSLDNIRRAHKQYIDETGGDRTKQSKYMNVIEEPILDIDIDHVTIPYLHIMLGLVKKHNDLLESECHEIDCAIATELAQHNEEIRVGDFESNFVEHVKVLRKIENVETELSVIDTQILRLQDDDNTLAADIF